MWGQRRDIFFFLLVGGTSALIDAGVFWLLERFGVWVWLASAIGFLSAFVVNYRGNARLVFRARENVGTLGRYVILVTANLILSTVLVEALAIAGLLPIVAKLISMVVIAAINYAAMRLWVFRSRPRAAGPASEDPAPTPEEPR